MCVCVRVCLCVVCVCVCVKHGEMEYEGMMGYHEGGSERNVGGSGDMRQFHGQHEYPVGGMGIAHMGYGNASMYEMEMRE